MVGIIAGFFVVFEHAHGGDFGITYHGRIYNQAYEPLIAPNVEFDLRIYESRTNCLLYREKNSADMAAGDGSFVLTIGKGTRLNIGETQPLEAVFNSKLRLLPNSSCPDGYTKQAGDQLYLLASFTTNSGPQSMSPIVINAAPYSLDTINVAGVASENVLRVIGAPAEPLSADGYQYFLSILNGTAALTSQGLSTKNLTLANSSNSQLMLTAPNGSFASFSLILPDRKGSSGEFLASDNDGALIWTALPPYAPPTSGTGILKGNGTGGFTSAIPNTDFLSTSGSASVTTLGTITTGTWNASTITVNKGGTGATTAAEARTNLAAAARGANSDITSLSATTSVASSGSLTLSAGGSNQNVTISPSGTGTTVINGNVGIGTTSPQYKLHVLGESVFNPGQQGNAISLNIGWGQVRSGTVAVTSNSPTINGTDTLFSTELKIGDTLNISSPCSISSMVKAITNDTTLTLEKPVSCPSGTYTFSKTGAPFKIFDGWGNFNVAITADGSLHTRGDLIASGKVGIGTTNPLAPLDINTSAVILGSGARTGRIHGLTLTEGGYGGNTEWGDINITQGGLTVTGTGTYFTSQYAVGDLINSVYGSPGCWQTRVVTAIASDTELTIDRPFECPTQTTGHTRIVSALRILTIGNGGAPLFLVSGTGVVFSKKIGIGTYAPTADIGLDGRNNQIIRSERNGDTNSIGKNLTLQAGGASYLATDKAGGNLVLSSGTATGTGSSQIHFQTATAQGASSTNDNSPTTKMSILGNGNVGIGTTSPAYSLDVNGTARVTAIVYNSDKRLKENLVPIPEALSKILTLNGVTYRWNHFAHSRGLNDVGEQIGVLAQDIERTFPQAVKKDSEGFMAVNYSALVGPIIEAFKEFYQKWRDKSDAQERSLAMMNEKKADKAELEELRKENQDLRAWICTKDPSANFCNVRAR